jgi:hypothetical protein
MRVVNVWREQHQKVSITRNKVSALPLKINHVARFDESLARYLLGKTLVVFLHCENFSNLVAIPLSQFQAE